MASLNPAEYKRYFERIKGETDNMKKSKLYLKHYYDKPELRTNHFLQLGLFKLEQYEDLIEANTGSVTDKAAITRLRNEIKTIANDMKKGQLEDVLTNVYVTPDTELLQLEKANKELNFFLGIDQPLLMKNPQVVEEIARVEAGDARYIDFLKKMYKIDSGIPEPEATELLLTKLRESLGLETQVINPLKVYRQASYISQFTQSGNKKDFQNFLL